MSCFLESRTQTDCVLVLQVSREVRKTWRIMINDWQNMSAYRPRKKIQRQKTTQKKKKKKQRKCTSTSPHTISESQKRESSSSSKKKLLWLWIRWKMQFCFGRCGSTVIHQKGTFVGKSSSLLSLTLFPKHKIWKLSKKTQKYLLFCANWEWSNMLSARGCVLDYLTKLAPDFM